MHSILLVLGGIGLYGVYFGLYVAWSFYRNVQAAKRTGLPYILSRGSRVAPSAGREC
jgi:uncharacterized SAM-binding protein YcdF (DUF218 family)